MLFSAPSLCVIDFSFVCQACLSLALSRTLSPIALSPALSLFLDHCPPPHSFFPLCACVQGCLFVSVCILICVTSIEYTYALLCMRCCFPCCRKLSFKLASFCHSHRVQAVAIQDFTFAHEQNWFSIKGQRSKPNFVLCSTQKKSSFWSWFES